jgi:hypothetical protein
MWTIRDAQLEVLRRETMRRDDAMLVNEVRAVWPHSFEHLGESVVRARVAHARTRAMALGMTSRSIVARFVHLDFALGERFEQLRPRAAQLVARTDLTEDEKIDALVGFAMTELGSESQ